MKHTIEYYLAHGYDQKAAEYFAGGRKQIVAVMPNNDFTLTLHFDNGETRILDIAPMIKPGTVFAFLADLQNFRRVYLDDSHAVAWDIDPTVNSNDVWSNKIDLCPDTCYIDSIPVQHAASA